MTDYYSMTYNEMSIDELIDYDDRLGSPSAEVHIIKRCAVRDAFLDLAEALDAEGLVVVPGTATKAMLNAMDGYSDLIQPFEMPKDGSAKEWRLVEFQTSWWAAIEAAPLMGVE